MTKLFKVLQGLPELEKIRLEFYTFKGDQSQEKAAELQEAFEGFCKNLDNFWFFRIFIELYETPKVGIENFACVVPFIKRNLAALENEDFCRDGFFLYLTCNLFFRFLRNYFLVANEDGLYDMEDRCVEALGDKTPFGVEAYEGVDGSFAFLIK